MRFVGHIGCIGCRGSNSDRRTMIEDLFSSSQGNGKVFSTEKAIYCTF